SLESGAAIGNWLGQGEMTHRDPGFFLKQLDWIDGATPNDVATVFARRVAQPFYQLTTLPLAPPAPAVADVDRQHRPVVGPAPTTI
ncbi:hypothetical protein CVH10_22255, partial [Halomonas sp. ND22Bw]|uniref:hypothetical protein n=1 Tax=Halomonas sp. ND22Bw TaxID=2054178 RepID=UPI000D2CB5DD